MLDSFYDFLGKLGYLHPLHPMMVHLPMGLVTGALIFALAAALWKRERLFWTSRHCIILALISVFPSVLCGIMDWQHFFGGAWLVPIKAKITIAAILTGLLVAAILLVRKNGATSGKVLPIYFLCFMGIVAQGYFGGQLVYGGKTIIAGEEFKAGEKIFTAKCSTCHPHGGNIIEPGKPVLHSPKLKDLDSFRAVVRLPAAPMPAFSSAKISDAEVKDLYDYIINVLEHPQKK
ncbi:MAG: c-type cytochrome [Desulfobulbaceae bacterium]|nr:c-type cytochrome [Desulfobulbaceae bacterium]